MQNPYEVMPLVARGSRVKVQSVNVGTAVLVQFGARRERSAYSKRPVSGPVQVTPMGLSGDEQGDLTVHGGLSKAVYAYPHEHYTFWQTVRAQAKVSLWDEALPPGAMGENLTLEGVDETALFIGDRLVFDQLVLSVSEPRYPCFKFTAAMGFGQAAKLMAQSGFCGAYLAVLEPGVVRAGDNFSLSPGPREVNVRELFLARMGRAG
jgi:MOSC domain-containing protein YiiM